LIGLDGNKLKPVPFAKGIKYIFKLSKVGSLPTDEQGKIIKGFVDRSKIWVDAKKSFTDCATEVIKKINPMNPITSSII